MGVYVDAKTMHRKVLLAFEFSVEKYFCMMCVTKNAIFTHTCTYRLIGVSVASSIIIFYTGY